MREPTWSLVVPVKRLDMAKTRLRGALATAPHDRLALALALDTTTAALACPPVSEVIAVTDDPVAATALAALGARVVPDAPDAGLNAAFTAGAASVTRSGGWIGALAADLPALRPADLTAALRAAARPPSGVRRFVADAPGTGTVLLTTPPGVPLDPRFGVESAAAHAASGARPLSGAWPTLRRDVDTVEDLAIATHLGLGRHTAYVLASERASASPASRSTR